MSPEAIQSLIEMFGVEKGVQVMNLFTVQPEQVEHPLPAKRQEFAHSRRPRIHARPKVREKVSI